MFKGTSLLLTGAASLTCLLLAPETVRANGTDEGLLAKVHAGEIGEEDARENDDRPQVVSALVDALALAFKTSPTLLAERSRSESASYKIPAERSKFGPTLTVQGQYGFRSDLLETALGPAGHFSGWSSSASAILTQPILTFGRSSSDLRAANAQADYAEAVKNSTEMQVLLDALTAYASVIRDRNAVLISKEYLETLERELSDNSARFQKREVTATDVEQARTRVELGREQLLSARRQASSSEASFTSVIGALPGTLEQPNPLLIPTKSLDESVAQGGTGNPVLMAAYARERISRAQAASLKSEFLPRVDLRGTAEYGSVSPYSDSLRQRKFSGEVVISQTLFDSGHRSALLGEAKAQNDADWRLIDAALRENHLQIANAWNLWITQRAAAERLILAIDSAQKAFDGAVVQEKAGLRTTLEVLDLARDLLNAKSSFNNANATAYIAQGRLLTAMGVFAAENLLPGDRYDTNSNTRISRARNGGGLLLLTPVLHGIDSVFLGSGRDRKSRDPSNLIKPGQTSTHLDIAPDLEVP